MQLLYFLAQSYYYLKMGNFWIVPLLHSVSDMELFTNQAPSYPERRIFKLREGLNL
jgi:hypothetical protein